MGAVEGGKKRRGPAVVIPRCCVNVITASLFSRSQNGNNKFLRICGLYKDAYRSSSLGSHRFETIEGVKHSNLKAPGVY